MSEDLNNTGDLVVDELESLKARATQLGIKFHPNIGVDNLREKVNAKLTGDGGNTTTTDVAEGEETPAEFRRRKRLEAAALIRVVVVPMSQLKRDWNGEIITVSNSVVGTFREMVPFNNEEGWHLPRFIVNHLKKRKCQVFKSVKDAKGNPIRKSVSINEFNVVELPPLDEKELAALAQRQAMAKGA